MILRRFLAGSNNNWQLEEVTVYDVSKEIVYDVSKEIVLPPLEQPQLTQENYGKLQKDLREKQSKYVDEVNILIMGGMGSGKSCLINGAGRVLYGSQLNLVDSRPSDAAVTFSLHIQTFSEVISHGHFRLYDVWGWRAGNYAPDVIVKMLNGELEHGFSFTNSPIMSDKVLPLPQPKTKHIHAVIFVVPANEATFDEYYTPMQPWLQACRDRKLDIFIVLTKVDLIDNELKDKPELIWSSTKVGELRQKVSEKAGIDSKDVLPLKNYTHETSNTLAIDINLATIFLKAFESAETSFMRWFNQFILLPKTLDNVRKLQEMGFKQLDTDLKRALFKGNGNIDQAIEFLKISHK